MALLKKHGRDWEKHYSEEQFPEKSLYKAKHHLHGKYYKALQNPKMPNAQVYIQARGSNSQRKSDLKIEQAKKSGNQLITQLFTPKK